MGLLCWKWDALGHMTRLIWLAFLSVTVSCTGNKDNDHQTRSFEDTFSEHPRLAAEWEPAIGTMVTWPLSVPYRLMVELAKDNHLYTLVENEAAKMQATSWFIKWGIDLNKNTFVMVPQDIDAWWVRDWGPGAVFNPDGKMELADGKYIYSTPVTDQACDDTLIFIYKTRDNQIIKTTTEDNATVPLGKAIGLEVLDLPFINTGGNVLTDGLGTAFSSCILLNENEYYQVPKDKFFKMNRDLLGIDSYHILSNFEKQGIQHLDCFMKLLDEERLLVAQPPKDHEAYPIYENIVSQELSKLKTIYGRPYEILRLPINRFEGEALTAYTNSLILNKVIYVPLFDIPADTLALQTWREVMPGYAVKGFTYNLADEPYVDDEVKKHYKRYGWDSGDALHCRTRAVWDKEMLYLSVKRLAKSVTVKDPNKVICTIVDYSGKGIIKAQCQLKWRLAGKSDWNTILMKQHGNTSSFIAQIPHHQAGSRVEYYISAASESEKMETMPRTAPDGFYSFEIR